MIGATVITGAAGTLGAELARRVARRQAPLVLVDNRVDALSAVALEAAGAGGSCETVIIDLAETVAISSIAVAAARLGGACALVNAAAILGTGGPTHAVSLAEWDRVMNVNVRAAWLVASVLFPQLRQARGAIVNVASTAGRDGSPMLAPYAASKAALMGLTRTLAVEWAGDGVRVNAVVPGLMEDGLARELPESLRGALAAKVPLGRAARSAEVASVVEFLISEDASYVTGECWAVDGGR